MTGVTGVALEAYVYDHVARGSREDTLREGNKRAFVL